MKKWILIISLMFLVGCEKIAVLNPKSETAKEQAFLIWLSLAVMALVLATVFILFARFVWKYRASNQPTEGYPEDVHGNKKLEITWIVIPIILLVILAIPTVMITYSQSPTAQDKIREKGTHINVTAEQFAWHFEYENDEEETGKLVIPSGEDVIFHLKSKDVIHSFWVPPLGGKVDVMPDKTLTYKIKKPEEGTYLGKCAEYCGTAHADMTFKVEVVNQETYENHIQELGNKD